MREELDKKLVEKYPLLYRDRYAPMTETAMCWGFCCGDGWYNLIDTLSALLCSKYNYAKERYDTIKEYYDADKKWPWVGGKEITPEDVEERRLEMEQAKELVPTVSQVKEKFGTLRFYINAGTDEHYNYIRFAENLSARICETCGAPGKRRGQGYIYTACDEHTEKGDSNVNETDLSE